MDATVDPGDDVLACDRVTITVLVDNYIDMLMPDEPGIVRQGMPEHFAARRGTPLAENGISFLVQATTGDRTTSLLFDAGLSAVPIVHNARVLGLDLAVVDQVVLSHGHPDHFGGIYAALAAIGRPVPLTVHPAAFRPRFISTPAVVMPYFNLALTRRALEDAGAGVIEVKEPISLATGVMTSGEIPTLVDFETEVPTGRLCVHDGRVVPDAIEDYQALIIHVRGLGLVVLDPCGHAGVVSSILHARELSGVEQVHALMGGFHLGHPAISQEKVIRTADMLAGLGIRHVSPMHCSGFRTQRAVAERSPESFRLMTAGSVATFKA
ncbi:MBL fold metallo-hydrolase [Nonomuraea sp. K274]|uniref:MBL fold metallo-hydrolase n=1 Tax=Nonomuraea cypriaca TaxID=1187855 RepID=A0A931A1Q3_9ACTN|nr:MBL fold metallo-hydrolase [Nonomuraea cypriaca]MBF8184576.1 MBL fold metallo-hydrolase [Nonomuraea cypriaca]